jgi:tRNA threonylcarbamoyladenosine biosynthesis protein TsaE
MSWPVILTTDSPDATKAVASRLASICRSGDIVLLIGELGAGKTAFAQGFATGLGVKGPVTSPTFALVRQYECGVDSPAGTLLHADVYRTESLPEVVDLALAELVEDSAIAIVEWGDMAAPALGDSALDVTLTVPSGDESTTARVISISGRGTWSARANEMALLLGSAASGTPR